MATDRIQEMVIAFQKVRECDTKLEKLFDEARLIDHERRKWREIHQTLLKYEEEEEKRNA